MTEIRVRLDEREFKSLVRGGQVTVKTQKGIVCLILSDIGFDLMAEILIEASSKPVGSFKAESIEVEQ